MGNFQITTVELIVNEISGGDYWYFVYDSSNLKIKKETMYVENNSTVKTQSVHSIFAANTEQECIDKIIELGLE